jgi:uncharacterized protein (TIGR00156 family)
MKKNTTIFLALICAVTLGNAHAEPSQNSIPYAGPGGFVGPDAGGEMSVKDVLASSYDDMRVILKGYITKRISHDKYLFTDNTGEILVEIDNRNMPAEQITPKTLLKIYGKVDKDYLPSRMEIEVRSVEVQK